MRVVSLKSLALARVMKCEASVSYSIDDGHPFTLPNDLSANVVNNLTSKQIIRIVSTSCDRKFAILSFSKDKQPMVSSKALKRRSSQPNNLSKFRRKSATTNDYMRQLAMLKKYRRENEVMDIEKLAKKWRNVAIEVAHLLRELYEPVMREYLQRKSLDPFQFEPEGADLVDFENDRLEDSGSDQIHQYIMDRQDEFTYRKMFELMGLDINVLQYDVIDDDFSCF